jgi:AGCS family alanine or glycine:cation symporter
MKKNPGKGFLFVYRLAATALVFVGASVSASLAWDTADMLQGLMVIINVPVIVILAKPAVAALRDYEWQRRKGKLPAFRGAANGIKGTDFWQDDIVSR